MPKYKVSAPVGNIVLPKAEMNEKELREFALQIMNQEDMAEVWKEKIEKDEISDIIDWLRTAGYIINEA